MRKGWPDAFMGVALVAVLFSFALSSSASESPAVPEKKIDLRADRSILAEEIRLRTGQNDILPAPIAADAQCIARYGVGHYAAVIINADLLCASSEQISIGSLTRLCAARFPNSEFAMLLGPELILYCKTKGKAI